MNSKTKFLNNPALLSVGTGFLLSLLYGLSFYVYRTWYLSNLFVFYSGSAIAMRVTLIEYVMSAIGFLAGVQLFGGRLWAVGLALLTNSLLLPWVVMMLSEDVYMAPEYGVLFFLPIWLSSRLFICQLIGFSIMAAFKTHQSLRPNRVKNSAHAAEISVKN